MRLAFNRTENNQYGYNPKEVDDFFTSIEDVLSNENILLLPAALQTVSFSMIKHGYITNQVDSSLERVQRTMVSRQKEKIIYKCGYVNWVDHIKKVASSVKPNLTAERGKRFSAPANKEIGYSARQVDNLCDSILYTLNRVLNNSLGINNFFQVENQDVHEKINERTEVSDIKKALFSQRKGKKAYSRKEVDAFLNKVILLLQEI